MTSLHSCSECNLFFLKIFYLCQGGYVSLLSVCWLVGLSAGLHKNYKITMTSSAEADKVIL